MEEIDSIKQAITALEAQRQLLGDEVVDTALAPLCEKLARLHPRPTAEQRKLVTVLFADLVGFTAFSERMDPEDIREIVNAYFTRWTTSIEKHGGVVEKFIGDAVMAVFGLSQSQEDEPENAVRAALEMLPALADLNQNILQTHGLELAMRVGIHTGTVMVSLLGERKGQDFVVVGDTVNLASRLQSVAPINTILISQATYRHVRGIFDVQALSPVSVKGKHEPVQAYQVIQAKRRSFQVLTRGVEGVETRLIGREAELARLQTALRSAIAEKQTHVLSVVGEAGIGKSRLIAEFDNWVELLPQTIRYFKGRASPAMQNLPYSLLRDVFSFRFQIFDNDSPRVVQHKFETGIGEFADSDEAAAPGLVSDPLFRAHAIGHLLGFRFENSLVHHQALQDPYTFQDRALLYLIDYFKAVVAVRPVVLLLEDIHWADESSLRILARIWEGLAGEPFLGVCTTRPNYFENHPEWGWEKHNNRVIYTSVQLGSLSRPDSQALVEALLIRVAEIPPALLDLVANKAEGNPFFIEELIKMLIEEQVILKAEPHWRVDLSLMAEVNIPSTLVEVLQARLDSLDPIERVLLQRASVLGRVFWDGALHFMDQGQADQIQAGPQLLKFLQNLSTKEMVFSNRVSAFEDSREFYFIHALLRDVTYANVLKSMRKIYHGYAAAWLETVTGQSLRSDEYAALIAEHYERADDLEHARIWYQRAAKHAIDHYANTEGNRCLSNCLKLWPPDDLAGRFEILMQRVRIFNMIADRTSQLHDLNQLNTLAAQLTASMGPCADRAWAAEVSLQEWHYYDALGETDAAFHSALNAIQLAQACQQPGMEARAHLLAGSTAWRRSDWAAACAHLEQSLALARQTGDRTIEADSLRNLAIVFQYLGDRPTASQYYNQTLLIYIELGDENGQSMLLNSLGILAHDERQWDAALAYFERSLELKRKIGHQRAIHITQQNQANVYTMLGRFDEARRIMAELLQFAIQESDREAEADVHLNLGEIELRLGRLPAVEPHLETALAIYREIDLPLGECLVYLNLSALNLLLGDPASALAHARSALDLAQKTDLSSVMALAQVSAAAALLAQGRLPEAHIAYQQAAEACRAADEYAGLLTSLGGLAQIHLAGGNIPAALAAVDEIIALLTASAQPPTADQLYLDINGVVAPFEFLHTCLTVLQRAADPRLPLLSNQVRSLLLDWASRLENDADRAVYLAIPHHQAILNYNDSS